MIEKVFLTLAAFRAPLLNLKPGIQMQAELAELL